MRSHVCMTSLTPRSPLRRFAAALRSLAASSVKLEYCPACKQPYACPVEWETSGPDHWLIQLRCGACGEWRETLATNERAKDFDLVLDRQCGQIERALRRIELDEMRAELDAFVGALEHDLIDASDFER